jgi:MFS family permease
MVGVVSLVQLPFLIAGSLWGGAAGDRGDRRRLIFLTAILQSALTALLGVNALFDHSPVWVVAAIAAVTAGAGGFANPLRTSIIPLIVASDELVAAYALNQVMVNVALVAGPSLAGILLASFGLPWCYFGDAVTFLALAGAATLFQPIPRNTRVSHDSLMSSIREGLHYVRGHRMIKAIYGADLNAMVFGLPRALFPAMALDLYHGGPRMLGLLYAAPGIGAVVMAFLTGWLSRVVRQGRVVVLVVGVWGVAMALFGLVHIPAWGVICLAVAGAMDVISTVLRNTILQNTIDDAYRTRVSALQIAVVTGGPRLGDLESGVVAGLTSTSFSIVSGGLACVLGVALLARVFPDFWNQRAAEANR